MAHPRAVIATFVSPLMPICRNLARATRGVKRERRGMAEQRWGVHEEGPFAWLDTTDKDLRYTMCLDRCGFRHPDRLWRDNLSYQGPPQRSADGRVLWVSTKKAVRSWRVVA
jgi:hypothetical protein